MPKLPTDASGALTADDDVSALTVTTEDLIRGALRTVRDELVSLRFIADRRYDRSIFPTVGQYDWLAAQVLYAVIRLTKPRTILEFSTGSGYSTTFSALALKRNGRGRIHTIDLNEDAQRAAARWLVQNDIADVVEMHTGDCRSVVPELLGDDIDIAFIDTLHSFAMAEWYLASVIPRLRPEALVHIHDVMPPEARVRIHGGPPFPEEGRPQLPPLSHLIKRFFWLLLRLRIPNPLPHQSPREMLPFHSLTVNPPSAVGELPTIDGNYFEEAVLIRQLLLGTPEAEAVYLHRLQNVEAADDPMRYASQDRIGRTDSFGNPLEWNDALWCRAATLQRVGTRAHVRSLARRLRSQYYHALA